MVSGYGSHGLRSIRGFGIVPGPDCDGVVGQGRYNLPNFHLLDMLRLNTATTHDPEATS